MSQDKDNKRDNFLPKEMGKGLELKVIDGFLVDFARVKVEEAGGVPAQNIACAKHLQTGADCYIATDDQTKLADTELVEKGKVVLSSLVSESQAFARLKFSNALTEVLKAINEYSSASSSEDLVRVKQKFKEVAKSFPDIPENLNQIDLAATWDWQIQQNLRKPVEMIIDFKPIPSFDFKTEPGPILFPSTQYANPNADR